MAAVLAAGTPQGTTVTYQKVLQKDEAAVLNLYVDGKDVHKTLQITAGKCNTALTYYTATATVKGEIPSPYITMTNGVESYVFTGENQKYQVNHVLQHEESGQEWEYKVTVTNTIDNEKNVISSANKNLTLQYWTVKYYTITLNNNTMNVVHTVYVRDGNSTPVYNGRAALTGYTFSHWSKMKWTPEEQTGGETFDGFVK